MPQGGEAGCRPRLGREVGKGLGTVGRGCRWCLAALLVSLEYLPLGPARPLMLSVRPLGLAGIPFCQPGAWREVAGLVVGWRCTLYPAGWFCCSFPPPWHIWEKRTSPKQTPSFFQLVVLVPENTPGSDVPWYGKATGSLWGKGSGLPLQRQPHHHSLVERPWLFCNGPVIPKVFDPAGCTFFWVQGVLAEPSAQCPAPLHPMGLPHRSGLLGQPCWRFTLFPATWS